MIHAKSWLAQGFHRSSKQIKSVLKRILYKFVFNTIISCCERTFDRYNLYLLWYYNLNCVFSNENLILKHSIFGTAAVFLQPYLPGNWIDDNITWFVQILSNQSPSKRAIQLRCFNSVVGSTCPIQLPTCQINS